jgi:RimJ/RimL family protein N-acetyltransferase
MPVLIIRKTFAWPRFNGFPARLQTAKASFPKKRDQRDRHSFGNFGCRVPPSCWPVLIGMAGIEGWPAVTGGVQVGCAFLPEFQGSGYGTEAVNGLTSWALTHPQVERVIAETPIGNDAAGAVLRKLGFALSSSDEQEGLLRFEKTRA